MRKWLIAGIIFVISFFFMYEFWWFFWTLAGLDPKLVNGTTIFCASFVEMFVVIILLGYLGF